MFANGYLDVNPKGPKRCIRSGCKRQGPTRLRATANERAASLGFEWTLGSGSNDDGDGGWAF